MIPSSELVAYLDQLFQIQMFQDVGFNGLQVENKQGISKVCLAVDACLGTIERCIEECAQVLVVHHGLFWGKTFPLTGVHYQRIQRLIAQDVALYAIHIPLDVHGTLGNNVRLAQALELQTLETFGEFKRTPIILGATLAQPLSIPLFCERVEQVLQTKIESLLFGKEVVQKIALCTGDASFGVQEAFERGYDLYLTGEREHISYHLCRDLGFHCLFGGHYATETLGLKALAQHLHRTFEIETLFLDFPTGL
jgi:dinuclear metal center YbgI/SA1388 family protein